MSRRAATVLAAGLLVWLAAAEARAIDQITVEGEEKIVSGEISEVSRTDITIKVGLGAKKEDKKIPANLVLSIRYDSEPGPLNLARGDESGGRYAAALEKYNESLAADPSKFVKTEIEFRIARTTAKMALSDSEKADEAVKLLTGFISANPASFYYYPALAQLGDVYLAKSDFANAQATFAQLKDAPWNEYKMAAGTSNARLLLKQNKVAEARAAFEAVTAMPANSSAEKARRYDALLGKAVCLQREGEHEQAVKDLTEISREAPATASRLLAETYVRQGDSYRQMEGHIKDAILSYMKVEVLFPKESALHAEALFWLAKLQTAVGHPDRAADAAAKLETSYPGSEWAAKLNAG